MGGNTLTSTQAGEIQLIDINGGGQADIVYPGSSDWMVMLANGTGFDAPQSTGVAVSSDAADALPIDLKGTGQEGLLVPDTNSSKVLDWYVVQFTVSNGNVTATYIDTGRPAIGAGGNATVSDINGDGLPDILYSDGTNLDWYENLGGGNFSTSATLASGAFGSGGNDVIRRETSFAGVTPDFDGTGRGGFMTYTQVSSNPGCTPDYCPPPQPPKPEWSIAEGGGYWNISPTWLGTITGDPGNLVIPMFVDFNGDGLTDLLYAHTNNNDWYVYQSSGSSLTGGDTGITWDVNVMLDSLAVDYSGNGREDVLLQLINSSGACTGLGLVGYVGGAFHGDAAIGMAGEGPCASGYDSGSFRTADTTGNGLMDLVWVANGHVYYALHNGVHPDLVTSISNGFSQIYTVNYEPLSNGAPYTPGNAAATTQSYPGVGGTVIAPETRNYTGPIYVVSTYSAEDGIGNTYAMNETYAGALLDTLGHGFLGFASTTSTDTRNNTVSATSFNQLFPKTGDPVSVTLTRAGDLQRQIATTWTRAATLANAQYVYASSSTTSDYEIGSPSSPYRTVTTTTTPTIVSGVMTSLEVQTSTSPASTSSDTTTDYQTDTGNWCLDLPSSVTAERSSANGSITRAVTYSYDTPHCRTTGQSVSVTDSGTTQTLSTVDSYDPSYGILVEQDVNASSGACGTAGTCYTKYAYDSTNTFVAKVTNALGEISKATWDPSLGVELSATDPNGVATSFSYDPFGLRAAETLGDGTSITWLYTLGSSGVANGAYSVKVKHFSVNNDPGKTETTVYDSFSRPLLQSTYVLDSALTDALTNVATTYDNLGRVAQVSNPYEGSPGAYTTTTYDAFNRPVQVTTPAGQNSGCGTVCATTYGYSGLTTKVTDPKNDITSKTVDALGEVTSVTDANGGITQYSYDAFGDLYQTTDAQLAETKMRYDTLGRKLQMTDPDMGQWNYGYDPRGLLTSQTDPKGQTITMNYDMLGRLMSRTEPLASGGTGTDTWTYDGPNGTPTAPDIGKLVEEQGADGYVKQYQYDSAGRPLETDATIAGTTYATNTAYDSFGRLASVTYPSTPIPDADDPPVAVAGANQAGVVSQTITLNGSGSYDPDHGPQPLSYKWVQTSGPAETSADGATTANVSFSTTTAGTYDFTLTVSDGELTDSAATSVTVTPVQVTGLSASAVAPGTGDFTLSWSGAEGATSYSIEQSTNGGSYGLLPGSWSSTSAALSGYGNGNYSFAVQGCGNDACGAFSSALGVTVLRTPSVPGTPSVTPTTSTNGNFTVSWSKPAGTVSYYELYTSFNGGAYGSGVNVGNVLSYPMSEGVNGTYDIEVAACNSAACSNPSSPAAETVSLPVPAAPTLSANPTSIYLDQSSTLSWTPHGSVSATYYMMNSTNVGNVTSYVVTHPKTRSYNVAACNAQGCGPWSNTVTITVTIGGCKTCAPQPAPSNTTTPAPNAASGSPSAFRGLTMTNAVNPNLDLTLGASDKMSRVSSDPSPLAGEGSLRSGERAARDGSFGLSGGAGSAQPERGEGNQRIILSGALSDVVPLQVAAVTTPATVHSSQVSTQLSSTQTALSALRHQALHAEMLRLIERKPRAHSAPQPLYAAEVETARGNLLSMQQAVATGAVNPYQLAAHAVKTTTTSRYTVNYVYDAHEILTEVVDAANPSLIYWQATAGNAFGQMTADLLGNGVIDTYGFDPNTGQVLAAQNGVGSSTAVANMNYQWDADGNLHSREDLNAGLTETFSYDSLNRLSQAQVTGNANSTQQFYYDAVGNLTSKTGVGTYNYTNASAPQQITSITAPNGSVRNFSYDSDGNLTNDGVHVNTFDALNRVTQVVDSSAGSAVQIAYTPAGARYQEVTSVGAATTTLTEVNPLFEMQYSSATGHTDYRMSIVGGSGVVAIRTIEDTGILTTRYITGNHLGGVSVISDEVGTVDERMSYDAFGERRDPTTWQPYATVPDLTDITDKGYTGQQQLDAVGLIHMNGRVYDPQIGRFVSADPVIPNALGSQSFNRYAYVENNPLSRIDPSGFDDLGAIQVTGQPVNGDSGAAPDALGGNAPGISPAQTGDTPQRQAQYAARNRSMHIPYMQCHLVVCSTLASYTVQQLANFEGTTTPFPIGEFSFGEMPNYFGPDHLLDMASGNASVSPCVSSGNNVCLGAIQVQGERINAVAANEQQFIYFTTYTSAQAAFAALKPGQAMFGIRPLHFWINLFLPPNRLLGEDQLFHEQLFYRDQNGQFGNVGYFGGGEGLASDSEFNNTPTSDAEQYEFGPVFNMPSAYANMGIGTFQGQFPAGSYSLLTNNCEVFSVYLIGLGFHP